MNEFPSLLTRLMIDANTNQTTLARSVQISRNHFYAVMNGRGHFSEKTARLIAQRLQIPDENHDEFAMFAMGCSLDRIKEKIGHSHFENQLPIRFKI